MPECHKCPLDGKGDPRCLSCQGPPKVNHKGRSFVSVDSGEGEQSAAGVAMVMKGIRPKASYRPPEELEMALKAIYAMIELSPAEFVVVQAIMRGATQAEVSREFGLTRQAINSFIKLMVKRHPVFAFLRKD